MTSHAHSHHEELLQVRDEVLSWDEGVVPRGDGGEAVDRVTNGDEVPQAGVLSREEEREGEHETEVQEQ